ncbi:cation:proton antiporter domain-containing protein [Paenirhodobacter enshiensis]|uniref:Potassium transporter n=1 Tax=Paenirhodobacter enshiensis TaxID=1105367 RepID=A0A086XRY2_9RHOB|nr:cation:proton antiporter [Paenirhodobacter enshiensis]KFI24782.1 potassium transporter [Paenirhodobacter enshiensis]
MTAFLFQATIYLLAMVIAVPLATRAGMGSVLGYLCAGILIGPVLGLAGSDVTGLQHFAEFGVVMMLFLIGLELEPRALWAMRDKLIGLGGLQVVATTTAVTAIMLAFHLEFATALALGMIFSLSSTAIVLQTMNEKRLLQTEGGRSAFAVLLTQDIAVIPMLAILPLLALPGARAVARAEAGGTHPALVFVDHLPGWGVTLLTLAVVAFIIGAGHYLVRPLFRFVHMAHLREINTAMALMIVVGIASLMNLVGLSPALGTFLAGVVLADSEFRHELESDIEPFKGLLLGLFFITVGAGIEFSVITERPFQIAGLVILLVALKAGILWLLATVFKLRGPDRMLFTLSLAQAGEFGFVLVSFAVGQRILPPQIAEKVLVVIALSMLITPALFIVQEKLSKRMRPAARSADEIDDPQPIIVAGIGRFGQVVNRMVTMSGFRTTVLDTDLKTIQLMRTFGFKGYYGDPTRPDLLAAAGIAKAKVLVVSLDDRNSATRLVAYARQIRPDIHIVARARDREHVFELYRAGANDIVREMFDSSLRAGRYVLENVGLSEFEAAELEKLYFKMDRAALRELAPYWKPGVPLSENADYIHRAREMNAELEAAIMERFSHQPDATETEAETAEAAIKGKE